MGVFRFFVPLPGGPRLFRRTLAGRGNRRAARRRMALLGKRSPVRRIPASPHRSLPSQRDPVYAWLELPHVSEKFWNDHPEWREKTALLQDAELDWRKLMNLANRSAFAKVSEGVRDLLGRFDWDGVNLAELYFESLEGFENPARLTPMNDDVRAEFRREAGFDPVNLFD